MLNLDFEMAFKPAVNYGFINWTWVLVMLLSFILVSPIPYLGYLMGRDTYHESNSGEIIVVALFFWIGLLLVGTGMLVTTFSLIPSILLISTYVIVLLPLGFFGSMILSYIYENKCYRQTVTFGFGN